MRINTLMRFLPICAAGFLLLAPQLVAQDRNDETDRSRSQQNRQRDDRDDPSTRSQSQRDRDQTRDDNQSRSRDQSQSRDQYQSRDQQSGSQDASQNQAGLGITLMDTRDGIRIRQVLPGSPAERAGLRNGDILLTVDDERVRTARDVEETVRQKEAGDWIDMEVWRNGQRQTIEAKLASRQQAFSDSQFSRQQQSQSQQGPMQQRQQFSDGNLQQLVQQIQNLERQLAQLRQEVNQMRSERQVLRPNFEGRTFDDRGPGSSRQEDRDSSGRSSDRSRNDSSY